MKYVIYDLPVIEKNQIEKFHKERMYRVERDRLKTRYFIYLNYPKINYHGLNLSEAKKYVYADFIARYQRLIGRNVLFSIGYNNYDSSIYNSSFKFDKPLYSYVASTFQTYQKELKLLYLSFDSENEILFSSSCQATFLTQFFPKAFRPVKTPAQRGSATQSLKSRRTLKSTLQRRNKSRLLLS